MLLKSLGSFLWKDDYDIKASWDSLQLAQLGLDGIKMEDPSFYFQDWEH